MAKATVDRGGQTHPRFHISNKTVVSGVFCLLTVLSGVAARAQSNSDGSSHVGVPQLDIIVTGTHRPGSIVTSFPPLIRLDRDSVARLGASSVADLLRRLGPMAKSADGSDPIMVLNARRPPTPDEISTLPPEAFAEIELLPEPVAAMFGLAPSKRVLNFITKDKFRAAEVRVEASRSTEGGAAAGGGTISLTRIRHERRMSLSIDYSGRALLLQGQRHVRSDASSMFDGIGNITSLDAGEIDPRLSSIVGFPVTVAAVPANPAARTFLASYVTTAGMLQHTDLGPFRSISPREEHLKVSATLAQPVGRETSASLTLSAERTSRRSLQGPATETVLIRKGNLFNPFQGDVLLNRYLVELNPLIARDEGLILGVSGGLAGSIRNWTWNLTGNVRLESDAAVSETGALLPYTEDTSNPFLVHAANTPVDRLSVISKSTKAEYNSQVVINGDVASLPTGDLALTATLASQFEEIRISSSSADLGNAGLSRSQFAATIAAAVPISTRSRPTLGPLGELRINPQFSVTRVASYGLLPSSNLTLTWTPIARSQVIVAIGDVRVVPALAELAQPTTVSSSVPSFDFVTGQDVVIQTLRGSNPGLAPEHQHVLSLSWSIQPFAEKELRFGIDYTDNRTDHPISSLSVLSPEIEAALPFLFHRNATGQLVSADFTPINLYRRHQSSLSINFSLSGSFGAHRRGPDDRSETAMQPKSNFYVMITPTLRLDDTLTLTPGSRPLNLLAGQTIDATGPEPRWNLTGQLGIFYDNGSGLVITPSFGSATKIRSDDAAADLRFSRLVKINVEAFASVSLFRLGDQSKFRIGITVENLFNARPVVRDRSGATPISYQPAILDPVGRTIKISLRKLFSK